MAVFASEYIAQLTSPPFLVFGEEPALPFQRFKEGSRGRRNPHDGHKNGEAEPGQS